MSAPTRAQDAALDTVRADLDPAAPGEIVAIREAGRGVGAWPKLPWDS